MAWRSAAHNSKSRRERIRLFQLMNERKRLEPADPVRPGAPRLFEQLEDRILFDAAGAMDLPVEEVPDAVEPIVPESDSPSDIRHTSDDELVSVAAEAAVRRELVIVDPQVEGYEQLVAGLLGDASPEREVDLVLLDATEDGISQITDALAFRTRLDAIHIVSHGDDAAVRLGSTWLRSGNLNAFAAELAHWSHSLSADADILFYGCDLAGSDQGQELVHSIASLTGADVAASEDDTGSVELGGDWNLEFQSGVVDAEQVFSQQALASFDGLLAVGPSVSLDLSTDISSPTEVKLGENLTFTATFSNTGAPGEAGFGPFVDLVIPRNGADGAAGAPLDGFDFVQASYLGQTLTSWELIFPDDDGTGPGTTGTVSHPLGVDAAGNALQVIGQAGDKLVVVQLPFGSFTPEQPDASITVELTTSELADIDQPLTISTRAGFQYGSDPLNNPTTDPTLLSVGGSNADSSTWTQLGYAQPSLMELTKSYLGPEDETATGPNHSQQYELVADLAAGQVIDNLVITDLLPDNIVVTSIDSVTVGGAPAAFTDNLSSLSFPGTGQSLQVSLTNPVTGGAGSDVTVRISFYVNELDGLGQRVIPVAGEDDLDGSGGPGEIDSRSHNDASASGTWTPIDGRDGGTVSITANPTPVDSLTLVDHILDGKAIAIQKTVAIVQDTGFSGTSPGDVLEYTLQFQISDYFTFGDLIIDDVFQDGQEFDFGFGATFSIEDFAIRARNGGGPESSTFTVLRLDPGDPDPPSGFGQSLVVDRRQIDLTDNLAEDPASDGSTQLTFYLSKALAATHASEDGILQGGETAGATNLGTAIGEIRFRTIIQDEFADTFPSNDRSVDQGDVITNGVLSISGTVRENAESGNIANEITPGFRESDASSASIAIASGTLDKEIYAINGDTSAAGSSVQAAPGDVVTYRIQYTLPTSDFENLQFTDYLPQPTFDVSDPDADTATGPAWSFNLSDSFDQIAPAAGVVEFGPADTFHRSQPGLSDQTDISVVGHEYYAPPQLTADAAANSLQLLFGSYDDPSNETNTIDLLFSVVVQPDSFADGLYLTNIVRSEEGTTNSSPTVSDETVQLELVQPDVRITKGAVAVDRSTDSQAAFSNSSAGTTNEVQRLEYDNLATGGTFTLTFNGSTTGALNHDATASAVAAALAALPGLAGNIAAYGGPLDTESIDIEFLNALAGTDVTAITVDDSQLTSAADVDEVQEILFSNPATGGVFQLVHGGSLTSNLAFDASAANVETALEALASVDDVTVVSIAGGYRITFAGENARENVEAIGIDTTALTANEIQQLQFSGAPSGGTFTLSFAGQSTDPIPFDASAADIQGYLGHLDPIGHGNVAVAAGPGPNEFTIEFVQGLGNLNTVQTLVDDTNLVGATASTSTTTAGSQPAAAVVTTSSGSGAVLNAVTLSNTAAPTQGHNMIQRLAPVNGPDAGTFTLTFDGQTTATLNFDAAASEIQTALEALSNIDPGDITVTGGDISTAEVLIEFSGQYLRQNVAQITVDASNLSAATDRNEIQQLTFTETPTGGTFRLTFDGQTTGNIAFNASTAQLESSLESLATIDDVSVTTTSSGYETTFLGTLSNSDVSELIVDDSNLTGTNEQQRITIDAAVSGGSFQITVLGDTTGNISHNASANTIRNALTALSPIGNSDVTVARVGDEITIEFTSSLADLNIPQLTVDASSLSGGGATVATLTDGLRGRLISQTSQTGRRANLAISTTQQASRAFTFNRPGSTVSFNGRVNSTDLATTPIDADIQNLDAGDTVTYAIVLENVGGADAYDLEVGDTLPNGFVIPAGGLNLQVRDGNGNLIGWNGKDTGAETDLFTQGIEIHDPINVWLAADDGADEITYMSSRDDFDPVTNELTLGGHGATSVESLALHPTTSVLYGSDQDELGIINQTTGQYTTIGQFGSAFGANGWQSLSEINGISFHPITHELYGVAKKGSGNPDLLFKIDIDTGQVVRDGFGAGHDYLLLDTDPVAGDSVDDFAIDRNGTAYLSDSRRLLRADLDLDNVTSSISVVGAFDTDINDMEGLAFDKYGRLWGTTGRNNSPTSNENKLWEVNKLTGAATNPRTLDNAEDYEGLGMLDARSRGSLRDNQDEAGRNILIITYDLTVSDPTNPLTSTTDLTNTATLQNYAGIDGGTDYTGSSDPTDTAEASLRNAVVTKTIVGTSEADTGVVSGIEQVAVGEVVRYRLVAELPEGEFTNLMVRDLLPGGLVFVDDGTARVAFVSDVTPEITNSGLDGSETLLHASGNESNLPTVVPTFILPDAEVSENTASDSDVYGAGTDPYFKLGDFENLDRDSDREYVVLEFNAIVHNQTSSQNDAGETLTNSGSLQAEDSAGSLQTVATVSNSAAQRQVQIREPRMVSINKTSDLSNVDAGDSIQFTVTFTAGSDVNDGKAFDVNFLDDLTALTDLTVDLSSPAVRRNGTLLVDGVDYADDSSGNTLDLTIDEVDRGDTITVTYTADVNSDVDLDQVLTSRAEVTFTSLQGPLGTTSSFTNQTGSTLSSLDILASSDTDYASQSGQIHGERDGSGVDFNAGTTTEPNDHGISASHSVTTQVPTITKSVALTSEAHTSLAEVSVGEVVRFRLEVRIPESTNLPDYAIHDQLPDGLTFVNDSTARVAFVSSSGTGLSSDTLSGPGLEVVGDELTVSSLTPVFQLPDSAVSTLATANADSYATGTDVFFRLGNLQNTESDASSEFVVLEFNAIVDNATGAGFDGNQEGESLTNSASVLENTTQIGTGSNGVDMVIREPSIVDVLKAATPILDRDAGDVIDYTVTFSNSGTAAAFDVRVTDPMDPSQLDLQYTTALDVTVIRDGITLVAGVDYTDASSDAGNRIDLTIGRLDPGSDIEVRYQAAATTQVEPTQVVPNTAVIAYTSLPGLGTAPNSTGSTAGTPGDLTGERTGSGVGLNLYTDSSSATIQIGTPALTKSIVSTSAAATGTGSGVDQHDLGDEDVSVGELITYQLAVQLREGTTRDVRVVDLLPYAPVAGTADGVLGLVSSRVVSIGAGLTSGTGPDFAVSATGTSTDTQGTDGILDRIEFDFGTVTAQGNNLADDTIVMEIVARVEDTASTEDGDDLVNTATLSYTTAGGTTSTVDSSATVDVIAPELTLAKTVSTGETVSDQADANDVVTFTLQIAHDAASTSAAFDLTISDPLTDPGLALEVGSVVVELNGSDITSSAVVSGNTSGDTTVQVALTDPLGLQLTDTLEIRFDARITSAAVPGATVSNTADLLGDSHPGSGGRSLSDSSSETVTINRNSISGYVFHDEDNDSLRDESMVTHGIAGVPIELSGTDHLGTAVSRITTTDAQGRYLFSDLRPSDASGYTLTQIDPAGYLDAQHTAGTPFGGTAGVDGSGREILSGIVIPLDDEKSGTEYNFGELVPATISGTVYQDVDNNAALDAGEPGIGSTSVQLTGTDDQGNAVNLSVTTAADGTYSFSNLRPSNASGYAVSQPVQPTGFVDGSDQAGSAGGTVAVPSSADQISNIVIGSGTSATGYQFGELAPASLSGRVYIDDNNNAAFDGTESGLGQVRVRLTGIDDLGNAVSQEVSTASDGTYSFSNVRPSDSSGYTLTQINDPVQSPGLSGTLDGNEADGSLGGGNLSINDIISDIVVSLGDTGTGYLFGELLPAEVNGTVFNDADNDGSISAGELGISAAGLQLVGTDDRGNPVNLNATTDAAGQFAFTGLRPGTYTLSETQPVAYLDGTDTAGTQGGSLSNDQISNIALNSGDTGSGNLFGELEPASLSGSVFHDVNNDGVFDASEPGLDNVTVTLTGTDDLGASVNTTTLTSGGGLFSFSNLRPGTYAITETQPAGYLDGTDSDGSLANGDTTVNDRIASIEVVAGDSGIDYQFGEVSPASLTGSVYLDSDRSGTRDGGELGISGVTVELYDATGTVLQATATTAPDGSYQFTNLATGDYVLRQVHPTEYTGTTPDQLSVTLTSSGSTGLDFGETLWSMGDQLWFDADASGALDPGEPGLAGVQVQLEYAGLDGNFATTGDNTLLTSVTDAAGRYAFTDLFNGDYRVSVVAADLPAGTLGTAETDDPAFGPAAIDGVARIQIDGGVQFDPANPGDRADVDFGYTGTGSIGESVFYDVNNNSVEDGGDRGLDAVDLDLELDLDGDGNADYTATTTTDSAGMYQFSNLIAGAYRITVDDSTLITGLSSGPTTDADGIATPHTSSLTLAGGEANTAQDFGYHAAPDYRVRKDDALLSARPGDVINYTITLDNIGTIGGRNIQLNDVYPTDVLTNVTANAGGVVDSLNGTITWNFATLDVGEIVMVNVTAEVINPVGMGIDQFTNSVSVSDDGYYGPDPDLSNNSDSDTNTLIAGPDLVVTKTDHQTAQVRPGDFLSYTISYANVGDQGASGVVITEQLPDSTAFSAAESSPGWTQNSDGDYELNLGGLPAGTQGTATFTVLVLQPNQTQTQQLTNVVLIADDGLNGLDPTPENNSDAELTPFLAFAYDSFNDLSDGRKDLVLYNGRQIGQPDSESVSQPLAPLPIDTVYTGIVDPGTTLTGNIYDDHGRLIAQQTVVADTGGNWVMQFPSTVIKHQPHSMHLQQTPAIQNSIVDTGFNLRRYFHPAVHVQLFLSEPLTVAGAFRSSPANVLWSMHEANQHPLDFSTVAHRYELRVASSNTSQH